MNPRGPQVPAPGPSPFPCATPGPSPCPCATPGPSPCPCAVIELVGGATALGPDSDCDDDCDGAGGGGDDDDDGASLPLPLLLLLLLLLGSMEAPPLIPADGDILGPSVTGGSPAKENSRHTMTRARLGGT